MEAPRLRGSPERIFISVDESTKVSTLSFMPADVSAPHQHQDDVEAKLALADARSIVAKYPSCTVSGPHFHAARPAKAKIRRRT
jgi:hypothetical protein